MQLDAFQVGGLQFIHMIKHKGKSLFRTINNQLRNLVPKILKEAYGKESITAIIVASIKT